MAPDVTNQETSLISTKIPLEALPVGSLFFTHGEKVGQEVPINEISFYIGRTRHNNLSLEDSSVSRKHAVINLLEGEYIISDLGSLKGTFVNGKKIQEVPLKPGDVINIGENRMQFRMIAPRIDFGVVRSKSAFWKYLLVMFAGVLIGAVAWFFVQNYYLQHMPSAVLTQIETHYDRGIELFNKDHDVIRAREEWKKILELDPEKKTDFAIKADKLLKNTATK